MSDAMPGATPLAVLFPGQGSQTAGMDELARRVRPDLVGMACELLGADPFLHIDDGTRYVQPAVFCASLAGWELIREASTPDYAAGHSLGDLTALVAAGALSEEDGLRLVVARGALSQECIEADADGGGMVAIMAGRDAAAPLANEFGLAVANDNGPTQVVLSGPAAALDAASAEAAARGLRTIRLAVRGPFHSPAMQPVVPRFRAELEQVAFQAPRFPVFSSSTAAPFEDVRDTLAQAVARPVRWLDTVYALHQLGVQRFVEAGPGTVLAKLLKRSIEDVQVSAAPLAGSRA